MCPLLSLQAFVERKPDWTSVQEVSGEAGSNGHFFDVRVFNPSAPTNRSHQLTANYRRHEKEKRCTYEQHVREVERASFTPLVFAASGGMGKAATVFYKRLAALLAQKRHQPYSTTMGWLCTALSFALLRSTVLCLRGSRTRRSPPVSSTHVRPRPDGQRGLSWTLTLHAISNSTKSRMILLTKVS